MDIVSESFWSISTAVDVCELSCSSKCNVSTAASFPALLTQNFSGNGDLTYEEAKSHFTAWSLMKSPLLIVSTRRLPRSLSQCLTPRTPRARM